VLTEIMLSILRKVNSDQLSLLSVITDWFL